MRVDRHGGLAENLVQHDIGGFAAHAWQGFERLAVGGDFAAMAVEQELGQGGDVLGFGLPEADGFDAGADAGLAQGHHGGGVRRLRRTGFWSRG